MGKVNFNLGYKKSKPDSRDFDYHFNKYFKLAEKLPDSVNLEQYLPPTLDQGEAGSCVFNSGVLQQEFYQIFNPSPVPNPVPPTPTPTPTPDPMGCLTSFINALPGLRAKNKSLAKFVNAQPVLWQSILSETKLSSSAASYTPLSRLFWYYIVRVLEGDVNQDGGAEPRDAWKLLAQNGICSEALWGYDLTKLYTKPSQNCYTAATWKITSYHTVSDPNGNIANELTNIQQALASNNVIQLGFTVYSSFMDDGWINSTGVMPIPASGEEVEGGHAVCVYGYDANYLYIRNSWGASWGKFNGDFKMPISFLSHKDSDGTLSVSDLWVIQP